MYEIPSLPPTQKQLDYARTLARRVDLAIPRTELEDRKALSKWIDTHKRAAPRGPGATSKQVAYAEKIARMKRRAIPDACFRDAGLMSRWIDANR